MSAKVGVSLGVLAAIAIGPHAVTAGVKSDLHGIALGMTVEAVFANADLPCTAIAYSSDVSCKDETDGSDYHATFSGGAPSVVLLVARSFCSHEEPAQILARTLIEFDGKRTSVGQDPNGYHIDLDPKTEVIINSDDGTCPAGRGKHYVVSIRNNGLITTESDRAVERSKRALQ